MDADPHFKWRPAQISYLVLQVGLSMDSHQPGFRWGKHSGHPILIPVQRWTVGYSVSPTNDDMWGPSVGQGLKVNASPSSLKPK